MNSAQIPFVQLPVTWSSIPKLPIDRKVRPNQAQVTAWGTGEKLADEFVSMLKELNS